MTLILRDRPGSILTTLKKLAAQWFEPTTLGFVGRDLTTELRSFAYRGFALLGILSLIWNGYIRGLTVAKRDEEG